jgi:hypothetical protein
VLGLAVAASVRRRTGWIAPIAFYAVWVLGLYTLMPENPDPVQISETILRPFRTLSLAGLVLFWTAFALVLAYLGRQRTRLA